MPNLLPFLNTTNKTSSKRKCPPFAHIKAAPTCTLSLTSVSASEHGSLDSNSNFIPFPSAPASVPFPSSSRSTTSCSPTNPVLSTSNIPLRPRTRTQTAPLRRRRSLVRMVMPPPVLDSSQVESESDLVSSTPPRKRARKASILCPQSSVSSSSSTKRSSISTFSSLAVTSSKKGKSSKKAAAELRYLCTIYRSIAWMRVQREFTEATRCMIDFSSPESMEMQVDGDININTLGSERSALDVQESLLLSRLRSYLIFNDMNPQWLDVVPFPTELVRDGMDRKQEEMMMDVDMQDVSSSLTSFTSNSSTELSAPALGPSPTPTPPLSTMTPDQVTASLMFRFRQRSKGKTRPEAVVGEGGEVSKKTRVPSPLAGSEAAWVPV